MDVSAGKPVLPLDSGNLGSSAKVAQSGKPFRESEEVYKI